MRLDLMLNLWNLGNARPHHEVLDEAREQTQLAEQAGMTAVWMGEHHFDGEGLDVITNPVLLAADLAARTSRIRLGLGAVTTPLWHPLRLAEDVATLDQMSGGRVDCGFSRGISSREILNLNPDADRSDPEKSQAIFLESLEIVKLAWATDAFTWEGRFHSYPYPGVKDDTASWYPRNPAWRSENDELIALAVVPKPLQQPFPPLWSVTESVSGVQLAAANDLKPITWLPYGKRLAALHEAYAAVREDVDRHSDSPPRVAVMRQCLVADSEEEARQAAEESAEIMGKDMAAIRGRKIFADLDEELSDAELSKGWYDFLVDRGVMIMGTPEHVIERLRQLRDEEGVDHVLCWMSAYGVPHSAVVRSVELFGEHVVPELGDQPVTHEASASSDSLSL